MNILLRWCFLALIAISLISCQDDDGDTMTPSTNNQTNNNNSGNNDGGNNQDQNPSGAFISGDLEGVSKTYPVIAYGSPGNGFIQAIAQAQEGNSVGQLSIAFRTDLGIGKHNVYGPSLNASILVTLADTTRNGGQFGTSGRCGLYNSTIEFTVLDTIAGEVEGIYDVMAYQGNNCDMTDSVLVTNGKFRFDYK